MTNRPRVYFSNAVYHICIRGNNRQHILNNSDDKQSFLNSLAKFKQRFGFKLYGLVIMDNHVHLVIETTNKITISKVMQAITLSYSVKFRKKYGYSGYVWQGRFRSNVIDGDYYISACLEYIHNNPIRAKMVKRLEDYLWSSFHFYDNGNNHLNKFIEIDKFKS